MEHGLVEWDGENQPVEVLRGEHGVGHGEQAAAFEFLELCRQGGVCALGSVGEPGLGQVGEAVRLGDDDAAELDQVGLGDLVDVPAGELAEVVLQVVGHG
nr:hypothetical protein [Actinophytocola gossypii]